MLKLLKAEQMKLKGSPVWLAFLLMTIIPALLGTLNYMGNIDILKSEWYSLWTQHTLFTCYFFLPVMIGVYCAYLMRLEHDHRNWNKLLTLPHHRALIFVSKLLTAVFMILISEIWIGALFIISGKAAGMTSQLPCKELLSWIALGSLGGAVMASVQLLLSLFLKSFALPVGIAFAGGLSGLLFLAKDLGHIWPYSLMAYGMNANAPQELLKSGYGTFVAVCIIYILFFTVLGSIMMSRRELW